MRIQYYVKGDGKMNINIHILTINFIVLNTYRYEPI